MDQQEHRREEPIDVHQPRVVVQRHRERGDEQPEPNDPFHQPKTFVKPHARARPIAFLHHERHHEHEREKQRVSQSDAHRRLVRAAPRRERVSTRPPERLPEPRRRPSPISQRPRRERQRHERARVLPPPRRVPDVARRARIIVPAFDVAVLRTVAPLARPSPREAPAARARGARPAARPRARRHRRGGARTARASRRVDGVVRKHPGVPDVQKDPCVKE